MAKPSMYILLDGTRIEVSKLRGVMQGLVEAQSDLAEANAAKQSALKAIDDAGFDKAVAKMALARHNKKQYELDLFDHKVTAYEEAMGWRDPDFDLEEAVKANTSVIDETAAAIADPPPEDAKKPAPKKRGRKPRKALPAAKAKKADEKPAEQEPPKANGDASDVPMTADEYRAKFMGGGAS